MATSINWDLFENTYLKPQIADIYGTQYDEETLKKTTSSAITDLVSKGLVDIGPLPSTSTVAAVAQINYLNPSQVTVGNRFSVTYKNVTVSFVATAATISNVTSNLTTLINANTTFNADITAFNDSTRIRLVAKAAVAGQQLEIFTVAERNTGTGNPVLESVINTKPKQVELVVNDLTTITANHADAFNTIAAGVKYFLVSDPVTKLQTAAGLDLTKDKTLTIACKSNYDTLILAYLRIRVLQEISAEDFWKEKLSITSSQTEGSNTSGQLTLAERIALINAEKDKSLAEIARQETKDLNLGDQKRLTSIELKQIDRAYELEDKAALREKTATNGAWTSAGQFTISYLVDYQAELEDTVPILQLDLNNDDFGIPTVINGQFYGGHFIETKKYSRLDIEIVASSNVSFVLKELVETSWVQVSPSITDNAIVKSYSLVNTNVIKVEITGIESNTQLFIIGTLKGY
ncbi:MAG: hypothetical protein KA716_18515 [Gloeotrichia echinulata DEX184]|nr:hypothetical protein [Gloeotrichia echinulata DEX184]